MQNKTARHWLPAIPRNIKLTELAAYVIILFEFMRTFFHGFYWQKGIRWRLASSPLMLYKSVGGECHVWLWNDFFVLHDNLLGIGRDRTRSQFRLQEVEVKPPSISHMVGGFEPSFSLKQRGRSSITSVIPFCLYYTMLNRSCQRTYSIQFNLKKSYACHLGTDWKILPA